MPSKFGGVPVETQKSSKFGGVPISLEEGVATEVAQQAPISPEQASIDQFIASQQASPLEKAKTMAGGLIEALITKPAGAAFRVGTSALEDAFTNPKETLLRMANPATSLLTQNTLEGGARTGLDLGTMAQEAVQGAVNNLTQRPLETLLTGGGVVQQLLPRTPTDRDINDFLMQQEAQREVEEIKSQPILPEVLGETDIAKAEDINTLIQAAPMLGGSEKLIRGATKAGLSALKPSRQKTIENFGKEYRKILAPGKGEIKNIEIKSGKNLDDSYNLAAENELLIEKTPDNKLDTLRAVEQLQKPMDEIQSELSSVISSKKQKQFDVAEIGENTKKQLRKSIKNDADYFDAVKQIDAEIAAIVEARGGNITASELNEIKQGLWSKSYNPMAPNSNKVARIMGNTAKDAIESAYPDADIKGLNAKLGEYITLRNLLENAHGRVVSRGKLGKYAAQGIGAVAGHAIGVPVAGELGGAWLGGKISDLITDPARITGRMARRVSALPAEAKAPNFQTTPRLVPPTLPRNQNAVNQMLQQQNLNPSGAMLVPEQAAGQDLLNQLINQRALEQQPISVQRILQESAENPAGAQLVPEQLAGQDLINQLIQKRVNDEIPLGLNRTVNYNKSLSSLPKESFEESWMKARSNVDNLERRLDEVGAESLTNEERINLAKAQDDFVEHSLEKFRRDTEGLHPEDAFRRMMDLSQGTIDPGSMELQQFKILYNEIKDKDPKLITEGFKDLPKRLLNDPSYMESLEYRMRRVKDVLNMLKENPNL